jgi:hypothetical protein
VNLIERVLTERYDELGLAAAGIPRRMQTALLTPRFPASRHVVALVFSPGDPRARAVAKLPRRPGDNLGVLLEADVLRRVADLAPAARAAVPVVLGTVPVGQHVLLVETAVDGVELDPPAVRRDRDLAVRAGRAFIDGLPVMTPAERNRDWYDAALTRPLDALARAVPLGGETADLVDRTHAVLAPLRDVALPAVFEHGDLSHPNLFLGAEGGLRVIDWERATAAGVPGHDLVFFLQYVSESSRSAVDRGAQRTALDADVWAPDGWARVVLAAHLERRGVPVELLDALVVGSWARTAAGLVARLVPADDEPADGEPLSPAALAATVRESRDVDLWWHALRRAEERAVRS